MDNFDQNSVRKCHFVSHYLEYAFDFLMAWKWNNCTIRFVSHCTTKGARGTESPLPPFFLLSVYVGHILFRSGIWKLLLL